MADYFTQFSCVFDVGSAENAARAYRAVAEPPQGTARPRASPSGALAPAGQDAGRGGC